MPLAPTPNRAVIPLPPDLWETYKTWMYAAEKLAESFPDVQDSELLSQAVGAIGEIVLTIDEAIESLDLNDALLPQVSQLLLKKSLALQLRYFFGDPDDFLHALHLLELLPQICDPADTEIFRDISVVLANFISLAPKCFLDTRRPSEPRLIQLIKNSGLPSNFMARAQSIVKQVNNVLHIPAEVGGCGPQSPIIRAVDWIISTVDNITEP